ncbi:MAG: sigma-70 family RNA polymerase sigma factor [Armatimonadota bacterium]|nr:sigma-70 family RNA polymerase sigma factor [Armatimonadota bacterium]
MRASHEEFERLVAAYERRIFNVALKLTGNTDDAADLTQETFLRAFKSLGNFRGDSAKYTWLYRILVNLNKDRIGREVRRRERETSMDSGGAAYGPVDLADAGETPIREAELTETRGALAEAIQALPDGYRECVVLRDVEGLSYDEIAEVMEITVEAVRSRLARARQQLRQRLAPYLKA